MSRDNLLMFADSEHDANMLYAVRMFLPGALPYLRIRGQGHVVVNDLEWNRARRDARHCRVMSLSRCLKALESKGVKRPTLAGVVGCQLKARRVRQVFVPDNFPLALARALRRLGVTLKLKPGPFFPERALKTAEEVKKISAALMMAEVGLAEGIQALKNARVGKDRRLVYHNVPLTSEKLRSIINTAILQVGGTAMHTIVAGGRQACDPHEEGQGPLRAHEPVVMDVFPRSQRTGYFGDISRTVLKGRASEPLRKLYHTVERAQALAFNQLRVRRPARAVHQAVQEFFKHEGYVTGRHNGQMQGFFHGTGHGIGLDLHEAPSLSGLSTDRLAAGHVVTVEPGLYYPGLGGVRLEDVVWITPTGCRNLTQFEKVFEI
ncbi:MAG: M24 family metallopeptidase [Verrucomicrobia bacterium]|nr:M24 family metallopeptidase [Verrucomicrobiota bacterium]